jgi:integrase
VTNLVCAITAEPGFKTEDGRGYSPHGLRHLCGSALAEAGCTRDQIKAILGHLTDKQVAHYIEQANRTRMAEDGMAKLEAMHDRDTASGIDRSDTKITTLDQARSRRRAAS